MEILEYLDPVEASLVPQKEELPPSSLGYHINIHTAQNSHISLTASNIAILGVREERCSENKGASQAPDLIREKLYRLFVPADNVKIIDLGNLKTGKSLNDTQYGLCEIIVELLANSIIPVIIGGTHELNWGCYLAYYQLNKYVNIVAADSRLEIKNPKAWLSKIVLQQKNFLFNFSNIGYQTYLVANDDIELMNNMYFDLFRLGQVRTDMKETEPVVRDADIFSFNINAVRQSDAPGYFNPSPNGLYGEEACQIARYAGLSDRLSCFGMYDYNPSFDNHSQTANLAAQIIWFFIEGYCQRKKDYPVTSLEDYHKFTVTFTEKDQHIVFYKSPKSDRWWMEVPYSRSETKKSLVISCSYDDYTRACNQEIPDRWWKTFQKIC
jgi:formiminoglutamase